MALKLPKVIALKAIVLSRLWETCHPSTLISVPFLIGAFLYHQAYPQLHLQLLLGLSFCLSPCNVDFVSGAAIAAGSTAPVAEAARVCSFFFLSCASVCDTRDRHGDCRGPGDPETNMEH